MRKTLSNIVSLDEAMTRINRWREVQPAGTLTKAFFISLEDLKDLHEEIERNSGIGVRAYLAQTETGEHDILLVAVKPDPNPDGVDNGRDILEDENGRSVIYDLTSPCPNMCDAKSPLFSIHDGKQKINLKDL